MLKYLLVIQVIFFSSTLGAQSKLMVTYEKTYLTFDLTFNNPNSNSIQVTKVGIKSDLISGHFQCMSGSDALIPLADYIVRFHVSKPETIIDADPIISIEPRKSARFTISIIPNATGSCGYWSTKVSAIVIFDDGSKIFSSPQLITSEDFEEFQSVKPSDEEILKALKHRDVGIRIQAINKLSSSTLDRLSIKTILGTKIEDENSRVRETAAEQIAHYGFNELSGKVIELLNKSVNSSEISTYCETLGKLKSAEAIDPILNKLVDLDFEYHHSAEEALIEIGNPNIKREVRSRVEDRIAWIHASEEKASRILSLCAILIKYQDLESIDLIKKVINETEYDFVAWNCLRKITLLVDKAQIVKNPFILSMKNFYPTLLNHEEGSIREYSLELVCLTSTDIDFLKKVLKNGIIDENKYVRLTAAEWIGRFRYSEFATDLQEMIRSMDSYRDRETLCVALSQLGKKCK